MTEWRRENRKPTAQEDTPHGDFPRVPVLICRPVLAPSGVTEYSALAYTEDKKKEVLTLLAEGFSVKETARMTGVSPGTVSNWQNAAEEPMAAQEEPNEAAVQTLLLDKAKTLLYGIDALDSAKSKSDQAAAIDRLLSKYLALQGRAVDSRVTISVEEQQESLAALLSLVKPQGGDAVGEAEEV